MHDGVALPAHSHAAKCVYWQSQHNMTSNGMTPTSLHRQHASEAILEAACPSLRQLLSLELLRAHHCHQELVSGARDHQAL